MQDYVPLENSIINLLKTFEDPSEPQIAAITAEFKTVWKDYQDSWPEFYWIAYRKIVGVEKEVDMENFDSPAKNHFFNRQVASPRTAQDEDILERIDRDLETAPKEYFQPKEEKFNCADYCLLF